MKIIFRSKEYLQWTFNKNYFLSFLILLAVELLIGFYVKDNFIRPFFGDFLVVILIHCFIKSFLKISVLKAAMGVLLFSYFVEIGQYFNLVKILGIEHIRIARILVGTSFHWGDMLAYTFGVLFVILVEFKFLKREQHSNERLGIFPR